MCDFGRGIEFFPLFIGDARIGRDIADGELRRVEVGDFSKQVFCNSQMSDPGSHPFDYSPGMVFLAKSYGRLSENCYDIPTPAGAVPNESKVKAPHGCNKSHSPLVGDLLLWHKPDNVCGITQITRLMEEGECDDRKRKKTPERTRATRTKVIR